VVSSWPSRCSAHHAVGVGVECGLGDAGDGEIGSVEDFYEELGVLRRYLMEVAYIQPRKTNISDIMEVSCTGWETCIADTTGD
jgi:hypothetical protein